METVTQIEYPEGTEIVCNVCVQAVHERVARENNALKSFDMTPEAKVQLIEMAQRVAKYQPDWDKRRPEDEEARKRTNPLPYNPNEEYELLPNDIKDLFPGEGFIRYKHKLEKVKAAYIPEKKTESAHLEEVKRWYAKQLMIPRERAMPMVSMLFEAEALDPPQYHRKQHARE